MAGPTYGAAGTATGGGTRSTLSLAAPASVTADKITVAVIFVEGVTDQNPTLSGWAEATGSPVFTGGESGVSHLHVLWHRATGSETGPYDFVLDTAQYCEGQVHRIDDAVTTAEPFEAVDAAGSDVGSSTTPAVDVTTLGADRLLLHAATNWDGGTWTPPASPGTWTKRQQISPDGLSTLATAAFAAAGNTGSVTATCTGAGRPAAWLGAMVPAAAADPPRRVVVVGPSAAAHRSVW